MQVHRAREALNKLLGQLKIADLYAAEAFPGPAPSVWVLQNAHLRDSAAEALFYLDGHAGSGSVESAARAAETIPPEPPPPVVAVIDRARSLAYRFDISVADLELIHLTRLVERIEAAERGPARS